MNTNIGGHRDHINQPTQLTVGLICSSSPDAQKRLNLEGVVESNGIKVSILELYVSQVGLRLIHRLTTGSDRDGEN